MAQEVEGSSPVSLAIFFAKKMANEDESLLFTARSATSLKRRSLFFTSSPDTRNTLAVRRTSWLAEPLHTPSGVLHKAPQTYLDLLLKSFLPRRHARGYTLPPVTTAACSCGISAQAAILGVTHCIPRKYNTLCQNARHCPVRRGAG